MIKQTYSIGNIDYTLIRTSGSFALYEGRHRLSQSTKPTCYELVMYRYVHDTQLPNGDLVPARLRAPSSCEWGKQGWTFADFGSADAMLRLLEDRIAA